MWNANILYKDLNSGFLVSFLMKITVIGGACGVTVIVVGNGHGDTSSNPGQNWLHFT